MAKLLVVGDGPVAESLAPMARVLGWEVTVTTSYAASESALATMSTGDGVVVLSHHDDVDAPVLRAALSSPVSYIGAMGARRTQERRGAWLRENGVPEAAQQPIHGPAGLAIGADGPPEIAVSILAEIIAILRGAAGPESSIGSLRDSSGPIHPELAPGEAFCPEG